MNRVYDIVIIGAGFSGSILARILASKGRRVALVDSSQHPRFAIGESSTPIADFMLRRLGQQFALSDLVDLSTFGSWQQCQPSLACGLKRGFSYFDHRGGIQEDYVGQRSLLVAASPSDDRSDTHWYRQDVDQHLYQQALDAGVEGYQSTRVCALELSGSGTSNSGNVVIRTRCGLTFESDCLIDASGQSAVAASMVNQPLLIDRLSTYSSCSYAHFSNVESFSLAFDSFHGDQRALEPFDADNAAQHHLIHEGWVWMLRMNHGITSVGITSPTKPARNQNPNHLRLLLESRLAAYPELQRVMKTSSVVDPPTGIVQTGRLQRFFDPIVSSNCVMMPTTAVTIDPLHSTGIAHGLIGVYRLANWILQGRSKATLHQYQHSLMTEAVHLDRLVSMAYHSMHSFKRFTAACMVYFAAAINCEERLLAEDVPTSFWSADDDAFVQVTIECARILNKEPNDDRAISKVRNLIKPWNTAGLFERLDNRYAYTATK